MLVMLAMDLLIQHSANLSSPIAWEACPPENKSAISPFCVLCTAIDLA